MTTFDIPVSALGINAASSSLDGEAEDRTFIYTGSGTCQIFGTNDGTHYPTKPLLTLVGSSIPTTINDNSKNYRATMVGAAGDSCSVRPAAAGSAAVPSGFFYGDGHDGAIVVTSTITLTQSVYATTYRVALGAVVHTGGFGIFATEEILNEGTIDNVGANAAGAVAGVGGAGGGLAGGNGGVNNGSNSAASTAFAGGAGGAGGNTLTPHTGGASSGTPFPVPRNFIFASIYGGDYGAGGGGGAGDGTHSGGGGGGGGSFVFLASPEVVNTGTISVKGGNGAAGVAADAAGGGGGGGGVAYLFGSSLTLGTVNVSGGTGGAGAGTGAAGAAGSSGSVVAVSN